MEILLAYKAHDGGARDPFTSLLPVGLGYINACLRKEGYRSRIANFSHHSWREIGECLAAHPPAIFGVSQFTHNRFDSLRLARLAKEINPACFVVFGGPHASCRFHEVLSRYDAIDAVVVGEGEETFSELVRHFALNGKSGLESVQGIAFRGDASVTATPPRRPRADLDSFPFPASSLGDAIGVDIHRQLEFLITSRGCPSSCEFCSSPGFWGKRVRFRSPRSVVDEIKFIRDRFGLIYFSIRDDTFTADRKRVLEFCRLMEQEKVYVLWNCQSRVSAVDEEILFRMKRAGCESIQYGVESGSVKVLRTLGKKITPAQVVVASELTRRAGINSSLYLMTGIPGENENDLRETLSLLESAKAGDGMVSPLAYYPGTALYEKGANSGAVGNDLFEASRKTALYARSDPFVSHSVKTLLKQLEDVARRNRFTESDIASQKKTLGYCHATNIMAGEMYEESSKWRLAEKEYREIMTREPMNPWGWLMAGELYAKTGEFGLARRAFEKLSCLVPAHAPAFTSLGELSLLEGDTAAAQRFFQKAQRQDPSGKGARKGTKPTRR